MGEVTVCSSLRGLCSPAAVAGVAGDAAGAGWLMGPPTATVDGMARRGWRLMRTDSSPSEISSSEIPDSSSNSINFLTLRMSIREPLEVSSILSGGQARAGGFERKLVSEGPKAKYAADREVGQIGVMPELLACEYIA